MWCVYDLFTLRAINAYSCSWKKNIWKQKIVYRYKRGRRLKYILRDGKKNEVRQPSHVCVLIWEQPGGYVISCTDTRATLIWRSSARGPLPLGESFFFLSQTPRLVRTTRITIIRWYISIHTRVSCSKLDKFWSVSIIYKIKLYHRVNIVIIVRHKAPELIDRSPVYIILCTSIIIVYIILYEYYKKL